MDETHEASGTHEDTALTVALKVQRHGAACLTEVPRARDWECAWHVAESLADGLGCALETTDGALPDSDGWLVLTAGVGPTVEARVLTLGGADADLAVDLSYGEDQEAVCRNREGAGERLADLLCALVRRRASEPRDRMADLMSSVCAGIGEDDARALWAWATDVVCSVCAEPLGCGDGGEGPMRLCAEGLCVDGAGVP